LREQRRAETKRKRWAPSAWIRVRASLAVGLATLALFVQMLAPAPHRMAPPGDVAGVAAELHSTFGDVAVLCIQADDDKSPLTPASPPGPCDDCCPLCQSSAAAHALVLPTLLGAPSRIEAAAGTLAPAPDFIGRKPAGAAFAQPRAPPLEA
jgi:hypothetical protein